MSDKKPCGGRARLSHNLSAYEQLRKDFNTSIANEVTAFETGLTPREVAIGYKLAEALSKPNLDLAATNEKLKKHRDARRDVDDDSADGAMAA